MWSAGSRPEVVKWTYGEAGDRQDVTSLLPEWRGPCVHVHPLASTTLSQNGRPNACKDVMRSSPEIYERIFDTHQRHRPVLCVFGVGSEVEWWSERRCNLIETSQKDRLWESDIHSRCTCTEECRCSALRRCRCTAKRGPSFHSRSYGRQCGKLTWGIQPYCDHVPS